MAEIAVSFALEQLTSLLRREANHLKGVHKKFEDIKDELENIRAFLKDADRKATVEGETSDRVQTWVMQLRRVAFRIEDVIDKYMVYLQAQQPHCFGYVVASLDKIVRLIKTLKSRHQIASEIQDIKSEIRAIMERSVGYASNSSLELGMSQIINWHDPRIASLFIEEAEVVGFEAPRDELIRWLVEGSTGRTVISVVGMGGAGKTTLAKKVFDSKEVTGHFDRRAWITVSQSYTIEELLREIMEQFCKSTKEPLPQDFYGMNKESLITQLRNYLQQNRYVVLFDDVWIEEFWDEIQHALPNNDKGSRIIITTRILSVAEYCKKSSLVSMHILQPLPPNKAWELFCKKAFRFDFNGQCPAELEDLSAEIVQKCHGLPLAIVTVGGLLSTKQKTIFEWQKLRQNVFSGFEYNSHLDSLKKILALSYDDLPFHLKSCFLHFGIYPEDHTICCPRLVRQWIAEGFIQHQKGRTQEEVAEQYLIELMNRSLVQVCEIDVYGKAGSCQIHDLLRDMIIKKMEELDFCHIYNDDEGSSMDHEISRRLSVSTNYNDFLEKVGNSHTRSMYIFREKELPKSFWSELIAEFKLLKVLDFEGAPPTHVPNKLGNLLHLRYLCLRGADVQSLPRTIGKLQNLETLDLRQTLVREMPREINKLKKLRHLMVNHCKYEIEFCMSWEWETGVKMKDKNIGGLTSLQTLYKVEVDHGGIDLIKELQKLIQLRNLGLLKVKREHGTAVCALINEMKHLHCLEFCTIAEDEMMDLHLVSSPPQLRQLFLQGRLEKLPDWVPRLEYLTRLCLCYSKLTDDPLKSLKDLPNLSYLLISDKAYEGEILHFEENGFRKLKILRLRNLHSLKSIFIDKGALPLLHQFEFGGIPQLEEVPSGIRHLEQLQALDIMEMPDEFTQSIDPNVGHWVIHHVPIINICQKISPRYGDYETRTIRRAAHS